MITEEYVIIPVEVTQIVPYGIGSVKIHKNGHMEFITPAGESWAKVVQQRVREGAIKALRLSMVEPEILCNDRSTTKDGEPCAFHKGHRFHGINYCASLGDMEADETRLGESK